VIDGNIRALFSPALNRIAIHLCKTGISANTLTLAGFAIGMLCVPLLSYAQYELALVCLLTSRLFDGLDGAVARLTRTTDQGAFLDITLDFIFYSAFVLGAVLGNPEAALAGAFLIFGFVANGSAFLAFSIFAQKHGISTELRGPKSIYYIGGLAEGFETIVAFVLICLMPSLLGAIAVTFGALCLISASYRIYYAYFRLVALTNKLDSGPTKR
jgi:phosphatidylglycerophosphate synthase